MHCLLLKVRVVSVAEVARKSLILMSTFLV